MSKIKKFSGFPEVFEDKLIYSEDIPFLSADDWKDIERKARLSSGIRKKELSLNPIQGNFDLEHLAAIHGYLFQDVSSVAGMVRSVGMQGHGTVFARPEKIEEIFAVQIESIKKDMLKCETFDQFAVVSANMLNHINFAHPFREGNGRSTRIFMEQLAGVFNVSYRLDNLSVHERDAWYSACASGFKNDLKPLVQFFQNQIMTKEASETLNLFSMRLQQQNLPEQQFKYLYEQIKNKLNELPENEVLAFKNKMLGVKNENSVGKNDDLEK